MEKFKLMLKAFNTTDNVNRPVITVTIAVIAVIAVPIEVIIVLIAVTAVPVRFKPRAGTTVSEKNPRTTCTIIAEK